jgi:hypothetical protein
MAPEVRGTGDIMTMYTQREVEDAYEKLVCAQGLVDFVQRAGFDLNVEKKAEIEGALLSIFAILDDYLKKASEIMDDLQCGYADAFQAIWKKPENKDTEEEAE